MKALLVVCALAAPAAAESVLDPRLEPAPEALRPQLQLDLGLSVIGAGYEHPISRQLALMVEFNTFGSYFLPWFDAGDKTIGFGGGLRATWFARPSGHGLYVTPYVRASRVTGTLDGVDGSGLAATAGVFVGWALPLTRKLDLRLGVGGQYIYIDADPMSASTPFFGLDAVIGYRL